MDLMLKSFVDVFTNAYGLVGVICMVLGLSFMFTAKSFARTVRKTKEIERGDKFYNSWFYIGVALVVIGVVALACMILVK